MICRYLRRISAWYSCLLLAICVAFAGVAGFLQPPPSAAEDDEAPAITIRGPEAPPPALAQGLGGRSERQAQVSRQSLPRPVRTGQFTAAGLQQRLAKRPVVHRQPRDLPRRSLPARHYLQRTSDDSSDPLLS